MHNIDILDLIILIILIITITVLLLLTIYFVYDNHNSQPNQDIEVINLDESDINYEKAVLSYLNHNNILVYNGDTIVMRNRQFGFCANFEHIIILYMLLRDYYKIHNFKMEFIWDVNTDNFKYHENSKKNSFYLYFDNKRSNKNLADHKLLQQLPKIFYDDFEKIKDKYDSWNKEKFYNEIYNNYEHRKYVHDMLFNDITVKKNILDYVDNYCQTNFTNKKVKKIYGLHLRSLYQLIENTNKKINNNDVCMYVKNQIDDGYIYLATDNLPCIEIAQSVFGKDKVLYRSDITRCENQESDSIPCIDKYIGYKLGWDILTDVLILSNTMTVFMRPSNISNFLVYYNPTLPIKFIGVF